jgi:hypothetical protein
MNEQKVEILALLDMADDWIWNEIVEEEIDALVDLELDPYRGDELDSTLASILIRMLKIKRDCDDEEARTYPDGDGGWRKA